MLLAMARDIRVILVKLADRLHNMRTLDALDPARRRRIARETLDIYAPIANRLGLNALRVELEELGFRALYPMRYRVLAAEVKRTRGHRKQVMKRIETAIKRRLRQEGIEAKVSGREKHLYGVYQKMRRKRVSFSDVYDVHGFRILVENVDTCYRVLGSMHNLYKPIPGRFKDYIAIPKTNGYQSLHTVLMGPYGLPVEVQIRTEDMHAIAESGIAAHWLYKSAEEHTSAAQARARTWIREMLEMQKTAGNSLEFIDNVKVDLFPEEVYVFTPAGEIMELPRGATPIDFAYAVHTDVGNTCVAARIDRKYAPLRTPLVTGQTVEVITAPWGRPSPTWLGFVVTGKARANIRSYLKQLQHDEAIVLGRRLLDQALARASLTVDGLSEERVRSLVAETGLGSFEELLAEIGLGRRLAALVAKRLVAGDEREAVRGQGEGTLADQPLFLKGTEGMVVTFGRCCHPLPGDPIAGHLSRGRGIVVHRQSCSNLAELRSRPENWIDVEWAENVDGVFPVDIRIDVENRKGVLATVAATIADMDVNISNVAIEDRDGVYSALLFTLDVRDRRHLAAVFRQLRGIPQVQRIARR